MTNCYIQKLATPLSSGENIKLMIKYMIEDNLPEEIQVYDGRGNAAFIIKDDGTGADTLERDGMYSTYYDFNIQDFLTEVSEKEDQLADKGGYYKYRGHEAEWMDHSTLPTFDADGFNNNQPVEIPESMLHSFTCELDIKKENSLFITDLSVIENDARTWNCYTNEGNIDGAWTIQRMIENMANTPVTGIPKDSFLRAWVRTLTKNYTLGPFANGANFDNIHFENIKSRLIASPNMDMFLGNWIRKARNYPTPNGWDSTVTIDNWENKWDHTNPESLWANIPFRLMAIVNRMDLLGNIGYNTNISEAGETRFIFTLVNPNTGMPIEHPCIGAVGPNLQGGTTAAIDWVGMNVIFEYGNPINNSCDAFSLAQQWYQLSQLQLGDDDYLEALENITNPITAAGAAPGKNFNENAINQIRTNEKIFSGIAFGIENCTVYNGQGFFNPPADKWLRNSWQLRQFELDTTGYLTPALLNNTPVDMDPDVTINSGNQLTFNNAFNLVNINGAPVQTTQASSSNTMDPLTSWIFGNNGLSFNRYRVYHGNQQLPDDFLDGTANIYSEFSHHFGLKYVGIPNIPSGNSSQYTDSDDPDILVKGIRFQLSLNTCQGCHSGETKTNFTMMIPRGYGESANY